MSAITPQTELRLLKCPIESDNRNQMTFSSKQTQYNYFNSLPKMEVDNFTYQRKDSVIRFPAHIDSIIDYNYVMYQNEAYTNKWFYAFITNMEYVNDNMTYITIKTDVYQTWQFDIQWKRSFVEREHVNDDTIGKNTKPENLETGEYIINSVDTDSMLDNIDDLVYIMSTTVDLADRFKDVMGQCRGGIYNGVLTGTQYSRFENGTVGRDHIYGVLNLIAGRGQLDGVVGLFMCPYWLAPFDNNVDNPYAVQESTTPHLHTVTFNKNYGLDGYTPKNNKLYTYPYSYLSVTNGGGDAQLYRYEFFSTSNCNFTVAGVLCPGGSIRLNPKNYNGRTENNQEILSLGKFPICSYNVDMYTNWLSQNSINIGGKYVSTDQLAGLRAINNAVFGTFGKLAGGDILGAGQSSINGFVDVSEALIQKKQHELITNAIKGDVNNGDVSTAVGNVCFKFYHMSVRTEYARAIDQYFSMYGYSINEVKIPNITGRTNWNFVKTIGANIQGDIPENDINEIKSIFNNGVTLWHNPSSYLDYSQNNAIA